MRLKHIIYIFLLFSCSREIEIDLPGHKPELVVNCLLIPDSLLQVQVTSSMALLKKSGKEYPVAEVIASINGARDTLRGMGNGLYTGNLPLLPGDKVFLTVKSGEQVCTGLDSIPPLVPVAGAELRNKTGLTRDGEPKSEFLVRFSDPPGNRNCYEVFLVEYSAYGTSSVIILHSDDPVFVNEADEVYYPKKRVFSDELFNGKEYTVKIYFYGEVDPESRYVLFFNSVSQSYYNIHKRLIRHEYNQTSDIWDGIANPVPMIGNISNARGCILSVNIGMYPISTIE